MKITKIEIHNVRSFKDMHEVPFSGSMNIIIGPNNSGKSIILNSIFLLQRNVLSQSDITLGMDNGKIELYYGGSHPSLHKSEGFDRIIIDLLSGDRSYGLVAGKKSNTRASQFPEIEPNNLIYPYLSKRKVEQYVDTINESNANTVSGNFTHLYSKIDRLVTPQFEPGNSQYLRACNEILGFEVSTLAKGNGKQAVYFVHNLEHIPLTAMGEGVANVLGLIADLCIAENKIFLIEEPENDIHPKALKSLLKLIVEKSNSNQFFVSTHSNIVMKYLGATENSKIFRVSNDKVDIERDKLRISKIKEVPSNSIEKQKVLEELGYDFFDLGLWKAWLFLEESSAEVIIRDYLIKWFAPNLQTELRTFSANSVNQVELKFEDFNKLFVFLHLEPTYKNKVWVYIDSGVKENLIISKMRSVYSKSGWNESNFDQFSEHDFEKYYPDKFQEEVNRILVLDKKEKWNAKRELIEKVKTWIRDNNEEAKAEFEKSAKEIIKILLDIQQKLNRIA